MTTKNTTTRISGLLDLPRWMRRGSCRKADPELFFTPDNNAYNPEPAVDRQERESAARRVCSSCPVRDLCLEWAMSTPEHDGIWGGMSARERGRMRRRAMSAITAKN